MPMDFPSSPTVGQQYNGYVWTGTAWDSTSAQPISLTTVAAADNAVINGAFDIWQRGTSFTTTANVYTADRWFGEGGNVTVSRQTTGVPPASTYCMRTAMTSTTYNNKYQFIESLNASALHDKTVTFQVKLRRNASFTGGLRVIISKSSTVDANISSTWVEINSVTVSNSLLPTGTTASSWYTATVSATIPNDGTANSLFVGVHQTVAEPSGAYWEMAEAQLEVGAAATAFRRNAPSIQGELASCQRYYYRNTPNTVYGFHGIGYSSASGTICQVGIALPVPLRTLASSMEWGGISFQTANGTLIAASAISIDQHSLQQIDIQITSTFGTWTTNLPGRCINNNNIQGYMAFSAEL